MKKSKDLVVHSRVLAPVVEHEVKLSNSALRTIKRMKVELDAAHEELWEHCHRLESDSVNLALTASNLRNLTSNLEKFHDGVRTVVRSEVSAVMERLLKLEMRRQVSEIQKTIMHQEQAVHGRLARMQDLLDHRIAQLEGQVMNGVK